MRDYETVIKNNLISTLKQSKHPLIIYPAAKAGTAILNACLKNNINIEAMCDDGSLKNKYVSGKPVYCLEDIFLRYPDAEFIITFDNYDILSSKIENLGNANNKWHLGLVLLDAEDIDFTQDTENFIINITRCSFERSREVHINYYRDFPEDYVYIPSTGINNTNVCAQKCLNCQQYQPYIINPHHFDYSRQKEIFDQFMNLVDEIYQFELCGGEFFIDPNWPKYVELVRPYIGNKIKLCTITTCGKVKLKSEDIKILPHEKFYIKISDYPHLKERQANFMKSLREHQVWHYPLINTWFEAVKPKKYNRTPEENQIVFDNCQAKLDPVIHYDLGLHKCLKTTIFREMGFTDFPDIEGPEGDRLDFMKMLREGKSEKEVKIAINTYLHCTKPLALCDYCFSHSYTTPDTMVKRVLPGVQYDPKIHS